MILHLEDMPILQQHALVVGDFCLLKDFNIGDRVTPVDVEEGADAVLVEALKEL